MPLLFFCDSVFVISFAINVHLNMLSVSSCYYIGQYILQQPATNLFCGQVFFEIKLTKTLYWLRIFNFVSSEICSNLIWFFTNLQTRCKREEKYQKEKNRILFTVMTPQVLLYNYLSNLKVTNADLKISLYACFHMKSIL